MEDVAEEFKLDDKVAEAIKNIYYKKAIIYLD